LQIAVKTAADSDLGIIDSL